MSIFAYSCIQYVLQRGSDSLPRYAYINKTIPNYIHYACVNRKTTSISLETFRQYMLHHHTSIYLVHICSFQDLFVLLDLIGHAEVQFKNWFKDTENKFERLQKIGKSCMKDSTELFL